MRNRGYWVLIIMFLTLFSNCDQPKKMENVPVKLAKSKYQCPMRCSDEVFEQNGNCPVCGTKLEKIVEG
jgi:Heavy metal binding domain